ncbi:unnamed protein product [Paramecium pentaurelia]|uniref:Uncharacterized protein n=1 Tax=Paramecium pentaurelia TaxID=43138 RepID=A0A8S1WHB7_9CILI|nr:unnamed protein product [Paramecium pentaurelia]
MNWSNVSFHLLKYESVRQKENQFEQQQQKTSLNNNSFSIPSKQEQLQEKIRCKSDQCDEFGNYSNKYKIFHDLIVEFPQHKKQRLTQIIVQNLKKNPISFQQNSFRNIVVKSQGPQNNVISTFNKRLKDIKHQEQEVNLDSKTGMDLHNKNVQKIIKQEKFSKVEIDPSIETMHTGIFSCSPGESPRVKAFKKTTNKFILKQTLQKTNIIDKIICESKINQKTTYSPRSIVNHQHKKTNSSGHSAYSEQNKFLRRIIGNSLFLKTLNKQL